MPFHEMSPQADGRRRCVVLQRILVPLDGSELAEAVLPYVKEISQRCDTIRVTLLQVVRPPGGHTAATFLPMDSDFPTEMSPGSGADVEAVRYPIYREQEIESVRSQAEASLTPVARQLREDGLDVQVEVAFGRPADQIVQFAEEEGMDLIAMCTHGRSGIGRWILGSVADKVLRGTHLPVMLVRPPSITGIPFPPQAEVRV
jgi:nucleotide-binding universal stress UspA family protein